MLCALCISIFQGPAKEGHHHASFRDLVMAANSGCKICKYLCRFREDLGPDEAGELHTDPFTRFRYGKYDDEEAPFINFMADVSWLEHDLPWKHVYLHVSDPKATPEWWSQFLEVARKDLHTEPWHVRNDKFPKRSIAVNTGGAEVLQLASDWLKACKTNHDTCPKIQKDADYKYYPGRLLDIADIDTQVCRLLVTENGNLTDGSGYVALSHCWGKDPSFLTLTSWNMNELQREIPLYRLPKTFVDSFHICRQLGFRYLWIDSLCIIQSGPGAEEDWQEHAATMDSIYANCELNLAVSCAENAEQGAFVDRDPEFLQTAFVYVPITMNLSGVTEALLPDETDFSHAASIDTPVGIQQLTIKDGSLSPETKSSLVTIFAAWYDFQSALWSLPLQKRGWVIQERLMASRALYFGRDRIYWECKERVQNEYLPWGIPGSGIVFDAHYQRAFNLPDSIFEPRLNPSTCEDISSLHRAWYCVINDYSTTTLTYPNKDKLVAIAAIAKKFNCVLNSQYIAGLFRSDLPLGLLWQQSKLVCFPRDCEGNGWENGWREKIFLDSQRDCAYRAPSWSWGSLDGPIYFSAANWGQGSSCTWQESRRIVSTVVNVGIDLLDQRNPYGQLSSAEITIEGPVSRMKLLSQCNWRFKIGEAERYDDCEQPFALHIFEENGDVRPCVYGLILCLSGTNTYRRIGMFTCEGPGGSRYLASNFERAIVKIV